MWPFNEKSGYPPGRSGGNVPTERVMALSSQGISEPDIIRTLKNEGYSPTQVDSAMREAMRGTVSGPGIPSDMGSPPMPMESQDPYPPGPPPTRDFNELALPDLRDDDLPPPAPGGPPAAPAPISSMPVQPRPGQTPGAPQPIETRPRMPALHLREVPRSPEEMENFRRESMPEIPQGSRPEQDIHRLRERHSREEVIDNRRRALEELAEAIVDEKMIKIQEDITGVRKNVSDLSEKLSSLEQNINLVKGEKSTELQTLDGKIDSFKSSIGELSGKMEAIERAMKDTLTPMMQSMRSLSDTIRDMKDNEK